MVFDSRFFFTGSTTLGLMFLLDGDWLLLPLCIVLMFVAAFVEESQQVRALSPDTLDMLLEGDAPPLLPLECFEGQQLMFYQAGCPVYRYLLSEQGRWCYVAMDDAQKPWPVEMIRVYPGVVYRKD